MLAFTEALLADPDLAIDPARVYLGGLSSGAGQALVTGCLAPDVFAGIAVAGGPGLGTEASAIGGVATTAPAVADLCARLAGPHAAALAGQRAAIVVGDRDFIVAQGYAPVNAEGLATAYRATPAGTAPLDPGEVRLWMDASGPRVALLTVPGLDHAWPGGAGEGPTLEFVARGGLDFAAWSLAFFGGPARAARRRPAADGSARSARGSPGRGGVPDARGRRRHARRPHAAPGGLPGRVWRRRCYLPGALQRVRRPDAVPPVPGA
ncbi:MAG: hypothetical protein H6706_21180 [Myxococcales bacterium]|nr:hypothetical protein [Myxococcales bacterium]